MCPLFLHILLYLLLCCFWILNISSRPADFCWFKFVTWKHAFIQEKHILDSDGEGRVPDVLILPRDAIRCPFKVEVQIIDGLSQVVTAIW